MIQPRRSCLSRHLALMLGAVLAAGGLAGCQTTAGGSDEATATLSPTPPTPRVFSEAERDPDRLRFMKPDKVRALIGEPQFERHETRVMVWQYKAQDCVMDLFWYQTETGPELMHYEARDGRKPLATEARNCFSGLLARRAESARS